MEGAQVAPRKLAALFDEWMYLIGEEVEVFVRGFAERPAPPTLDEYQAEIDKLQHAAHTARNLCCDEVRTGEERHGARGVDTRVRVVRWTAWC